MGFGKYYLIFYFVPAGISYSVTQLDSDRMLRNIFKLTCYPASCRVRKVSFLHSSKRLEAITEMLCCCRNGTVCFSLKKNQLPKWTQALILTLPDKIVRNFILSKKPPYSQIPQ